LRLAAFLLAASFKLQAARGDPEWEGAFLKLIACLLAASLAAFLLAASLAAFLLTACFYFIF
jgi:hypothetical protein